MKNDNPSERAVALVHEAIDVLLRAGQAPDSPVNTFLTATLRREFRRGAVRLRQRKAQPRYTNLHTSDELADVYERTVQRDEVLDRGVEQFKRITRDLGLLLEENGAEVEKAVETLVVEAQRSAAEHGPGSDAAQRYRYLRLLAWFSQQSHVHRRRQRVPPRWRFPLAEDPSIETRNQMIAAESIDSPPSSGEAVIAIPPEGMDSGRGRIFLRIGIGDASWIGSFERGHANVSTVSMMPDGKHLFVSAGGAGYIIDAKSRTLVETIGTEVTGVMVDHPRTVFIVDHNGLSLEGFGRSGRLWKTDAIGSGGFDERRSPTLTSSAKRGSDRGGHVLRWISPRGKSVFGRKRLSAAADAVRRRCFRLEPCRGSKEFRILP
jgi:hypothetical protein